MAVNNGDQWYRGRVVSVEYDYSCTIFFVDFGRTGMTTIASVRPLNGEIAEKAAFALRCCEIKVMESGIADTDNADDAAQQVLAGYVGNQVEVTVKQFQPACEDSIRGSDEDAANVELHLPNDVKYLALLKDAAMKPE